MPTLLLDKQKCLANIAAMAKKARDHGLAFRPHCKTHQSATIASWFRDFGVDSITVSSLPMARYFAKHGWKDILVAFPFNPAHLDILNELSRKIRMSVLIDNPESISFLKQVDSSMDFYIEVDTGYGRSGVQAENAESMEEIIRTARAMPHLNFRGFYCHAGHSYQATALDAKIAIHRKALRDLARLKSDFGGHDCKSLYGDTPLCSSMDDFSGINEITPGNFIFYDLVQHMLGSCSLNQIAVAMACTVCGKYEGNRILIHGGAVHFSKEKMAVGGRDIYGRAVVRNPSGWEDPDGESYLTSLSQEHGILEGCPSLFERTSIGDELLVLPVHSCLTANLMQGYLYLEGEHIPTMHSEA